MSQGPPVEASIRGGVASSSLTRDPRLRRPLLHVLGFSAGHFLVASAAAFVTYGLDLDRLRSRSMLSRASGVVHDILWYPHDSFLRALPPGSINRMGVVPGVLIGSSLVWGLAIYGLWRATRRSHS